MRQQIKVCRILCRSKILRLNSDIRGYFDRGMRHWGVPKPKQEIKSLVEGAAGFGFMKGCGNPTLKGLGLLRQSADDGDVLLDMANFICIHTNRDLSCTYDQKSP